MPRSTLQGWGEPIASWDYSTATPQVDFTGLGGYRELLIWGDGITTDTASADAPALRVSSDNGSTFLNTAYSNGGTASSGGWVVNSNGASSVAHAFRIELLDFNSSARKPKYSATAFVIGSSGTANRWGSRAVGPYNAIRIHLLSANFTSGQICVYGRN